MQKNSRSLLISIPFILCGCEPSELPVYVDLGRIPSNKQVQAEPAPPTASPPKFETLPAETIDASAAKPLRDPSNTPKLNVKAMFLAEQEKAFNALRRRLRVYYENEAKKFGLDQQKAMSEAERRAYQEANAEIRVAFEKWADKRAPIYAKLALFAGFPIQLAQPVTHDIVTHRELQLRSKEIDDLHSQLTVMDTEFKAESDAILLKALDKSSAERAALLLSIEQYANDLDQKAERAAQAQIREAVTTLNFTLADPVLVSLQATPRRSVSMQSGATSFDRPVVPSGGVHAQLPDRNRVLLSELRIWAALNRYKLMPSANNAVDKTDEFLRWKRTQEAVP